MRARYTRILSAFLVVFFVSFSPAKSEEITIGMGNFKPYFISESETGIFTDIITAVFRQMPDYQPKYFFGLSNHGLWARFKAGGIDAVSNLFDSVKVDVCRSDPVFRFHDVAISHADAKLQINKIADLAGKSIISFQGAKAFFGDEFSRQLEDRYKEVRNPAKQARILAVGRVDVSVGDLFIFLHEISELEAHIASPKDFVIHEIFPKISTRMGFKDEKVCAAFNKALEKIRKSGEYERIYASYLKDLDYKN